MSVFSAIERGIIARKGRLTEKLLARHNASMKAREVKEQLIRDLEVGAREAQAQMTSDKFPVSQKFFEMELQKLYKELKDTWLTAGLEDQKASRISIRIAAKIDAIETMKNRPQKLVTELRNAVREK